jgi:stage V sporulation protein D (sporulation-specific penicillin-binding protein)
MIPRKQNHETSPEVRFLSVIFLLAGLAIAAKLFYLQILQNNYYSTLAMDSHEIYQKLHPSRGQIFFTDARTNETYAAAMNRTYYQIYAVPKEIILSDVASTSKKLKEILALPEEQTADFEQKLSKTGDPYEPLAKKIPEEKYQAIIDAGLKGIYGTTEVYRYYPEENSGSAVLGFCSFDKDGNLKGNYGLEGYWNKKLSGTSGFVMGEGGAKGGWISLAGLTTVEAENGADIILTIDRALQYKACSALAEGMKTFSAKSASLVMMDPATGAILAICSMPNYDANNYSQAESVSAYNNNTIFSAYEPGSVMKPVIMSAGIDLGLISPNSTYNDPCSRKFDIYTIHNALNKCYGDNVSMTQVLQNSINTGMIWVSEKIGRERMQTYVEKYGFGQLSGVPLDTEVAGNISSLEKKSPIFSAQASFGQGLTVTPIQLALAYSAIAADGKLPKPYLVKEIDYPNGKKEKFSPETAAQVISPRTAKLVTGMLTSVVEKTYITSVKMSDYYIAGKTGTAQISGVGGYTEETNHTFCGFAPAENPKFVMVVRYEAPERQWAESTAAVVFKDVADFALDYFGVEKDK